MIEPPWRCFPDSRDRDSPQEMLRLRSAHLPSLGNQEGVKPLVVQRGQLSSGAGRGGEGGG